MLCAVCRHCGLCNGDGSVVSQKSIVTQEEFTFYTDVFPDASFSESDIGIAIDIGTTTIAVCAVQLATLKVCARRGQENAQRAYGSDVISRIQFALSGDGLSVLHDSIVSQLCALSEAVLRDVRALFLSERKGMPCVKRMTVTGNTAMLCFLTGKSVKGLSAFPFSVPDEFGFELPARTLLGGLSSDFDSCSAFIPPVLSAFVGADTMCALLSSGLVKKQTASALCDVGTNCEMALYNPEQKKLWCTSAAAGPAFEGYGISCGMAAREGAVARVTCSEDGKVQCEVIGGGRAEGVCGTGLLSAVSAFVSGGLIDTDGAICSGEDCLRLCGSVVLTQKDIRQLQLAKAAVRTGLTVLCEEAGLTEGDIEHLFLAGGFGTKLDEHDACVIKMFPSECERAVCHAGNASLAGAVMLWVNDSYREECEHIKRMVQVTNLAERNDFSDRFLSALNF